MQKVVIVLAVVIVVLLTAFVFLSVVVEAPTQEEEQETAVKETTEKLTEETTNGDEEHPVSPEAKQEPSEIPDISVIATGLEIPWGIAFLNNDRVLVTERTGQLLLFENGNLQKTFTIENVSDRGEGGLLDVVAHPNFDTNNFIYLYATQDSGNGTVNAVERYKLLGNELTDRTVLLDNIPGAQFHDGGRMAFGPDGKLYITTGDATNDKIAQERDNLGGKILRMNDDGSIPTDNPFGTYIYSYGHRNPQGLAWDDAGRLWSTEHGPSSPLNCCQDEVNLITPGANYGWPDVHGDETGVGFVLPVLHSGTDVTWAPASAAYVDGSIFFGGLRGSRLYEAVLDGERIVELKEYLVNEYGRLRTVQLGPDGFLYLTTSNRDGRGDVREGDDKILRINPKMFR